MSSFITSKETKQRIAEMLYEDLFEKRESRLFNRLETEEYKTLLNEYNAKYGDGKKIEVDILGIIIVNSDSRLKQIQRIYNVLDDLNYAAVNARYADDMEAEHEKLTGTLEQGYSVQTFKGLQCLIYQCTEDLKEAIHIKLYQMLCRLEHRMACYIVERMPAYKEADWN